MRSVRSPIAGRRAQLVQLIAATLRDRYSLPAQAVILEFVSGAAAALDEYSGFLTGGQMDELFSQIEGNFVGLGVELKTEPARAVDRERDSRRPGPCRRHPPGRS